MKKRACVIVRNCINNRLPHPMQNYFSLLHHAKCTRNNKLSIALPKVKTETARGGFYYQGALLYNLLPVCTRSFGDEKSFANKLNEFFYMIFRYLLIFLFLMRFAWKLI